MHYFVVQFDVAVGYIWYRLVGRKYGSASFLTDRLSTKNLPSRQGGNVGIRHSFSVYETEDLLVTIYDLTVILS